MSKYIQLTDYETVMLDHKKGEILRFACCDCGMVHSIAAVPETEDTVGIVFRQEPRRTGQLRRHGFGNLHRGVGKFKLIKEE